MRPKRIGCKWQLRRHPSSGKLPAAWPGVARCGLALPSPSLCDPLLHLHVIIIAIKGPICPSPRWRWLVKHPSCGCHMRQIRRNVFHILTCQQQTRSPQSCAPSPKQRHQHESPTPPASASTTTTIKESHKNCHWARCLTDGLSDEDCEAASRAHLISGICSCPARDDEGGRATGTRYLGQFSKLLLRE